MSHIQARGGGEGEVNNINGVIAFNGRPGPQVYRQGPSRFINTRASPTHGSHGSRVALAPRRPGQGPLYSLTFAANNVEVLITQGTQGTGAARHPDILAETDDSATCTTHAFLQFARFHPPDQES